MNFEQNSKSPATAALMWTIWALTCVIGVVVCWLIAASSLLTFFGSPVSESQTSRARLLIDAAPAVSAAGALAVVTLAIIGLAKARLSASGRVVLVLALLSPWVPLIVALQVRLAGE